MLCREEEIDMERQKTSGLFRCLVYNGGVSLTLIDGGKMCSEAIKLHGFHGEKARAFCGAVLCTAFLGGLLKENGEVSAVLKTDGEIQNITASASAALNVRACMDCRNGAEFAEGKQSRTADSVSWYDTSGYLQVVRSDGYSARPFVGVCPLKSVVKSENNAEAAENFFENNFEEYFAVSEQLPTRFKLYIGEKEDEYYCAALQTLPEGGETWEDTAKEKLNDFLSEYKNTKDAENSARRIFGEISCAENRGIRYKCNCSREYLKGVLSSLGKNEIESILQEQGAVKIHCRYCNKDYVFSRNDLKDLL